MGDDAPNPQNEKHPVEANSHQDCSILFLEKIHWGYLCLLQNRSQSSFGHISGMVGNCGKSSGRWVLPDFMTTCRVTKKLKAECLEFFDDLTVFKPG